MYFTVTNICLQLVPMNSSVNSASRPCLSSSRLWRRSTLHSCPTRARWCICVTMATRSVWHVTKITSATLMGINLTLLPTFDTLNCDMNVNSWGYASRTETVAYLLICEGICYKWLAQKRHDQTFARTCHTYSQQCFMWPTHHNITCNSTETMEPKYTLFHSSVWYEM